MCDWAHPSKVRVIDKIKTKGKKKECAQANLDLEAKVQSKKRYSLVQSLTLKLDPNGEDMGAWANLSSEKGLC